MNYTLENPGEKGNWMNYQILFEETLPLGHLTAVSLPEPSGHRGESTLGSLESPERSVALDLPERRRIPWIGGRIALKNSLKHFEAPIVPILATPRGAPRLPSGFVGSVSHKKAKAVGLVAPDSGWTIGVDLEEQKPPRERIESMILTEEEISEINNAPSGVPWRELLLRFSLKEAIYKAIDPYVKRFVGFKEVTVTPNENGTATVQWHLKKKEGPFTTEAHWLNQNGYYITSARIKLDDQKRISE